MFHLHFHIFLQRVSSLVLLLLKCKVWFCFCRRMLPVVVTCTCGNCVSATVHFYFVLFYFLRIHHRSKRSFTFIISELYLRVLESFSILMPPFLSYDSRAFTQLSSLCLGWDGPHFVYTVIIYCYYFTYDIQSIFYGFQYYSQIEKGYVACIKESTAGSWITFFGFF